MLNLEMRQNKKEEVRYGDFLNTKMVDMPCSKCEGTDCMFRKIEVQNRKFEFLKSKFFKALL